MTEDGAYRTDDMACATVLALAGYSYELSKITERKVLWVFRPTLEQEEEFDDLLDKYEGWSASVEPRRFIIRFSELRDELFATLGPRRQPVARSVSN